MQETLDNYIPRPEKPKYTQDWKAYDAAKSNEDPLFKQLLEELLQIIIEEKTIKQPGRTGFTKKEKIFSMAIKEYYRGSNRKTVGTLKVLKRYGLINKIPCQKSISNFYNDRNLIKELDNLILASALPLAGVETTGMVDATGFSIYKYESWSEFKWGKPGGKHHMWRKLHAFAGSKSNIFIGVEITEKNVADIKMLETVVGNKSKYFNMEEFVADKAYNSRNVFNFLHHLALIPYIPYKSNIRGRSKGSRIWREMFLHFQTSREEFDSIYHQRSNVETCFHMLKQRFGHHLSSKNFVANQVELKVKVLCHNLCVLIQQAYETNIDIDFKQCSEKIISE